jgi:hypothetical protein
MSSYEIHLVGSIPLRDAGDVFRTVGGLLGPRLPRIPDGETGERSHWLAWLEPNFSENPAFEATGEMSKVHATGDARPLHRLKDGAKPADIRFDNLRIAEEAIASFKEFQRVKGEGALPARCRFQVSIANPVSLVQRFVADDWVGEVLPVYERALMKEIDALAAAVPRDQLAIQWDIAQHIFTPLETQRPTRFGQTRAEMMAAFSAMSVRWGNAVPPGVELLYHLCYGDNAHRHAVEPESLAVAVEFANAVSAGIGRTIELIHMPVPRDRSDDAYFAPLARLRLRPETRLGLGLIHYTDGVRGTRARIAAAEKYASDFLISTECGFGRRERDTIPELLRIHAEVAGIT